MYGVPGGRHRRYGRVPKKEEGRRGKKGGGGKRGKKKRRREIITVTVNLVKIYRSVAGVDRKNLDGGGARRDSN